jgi:hypothetical protein
MSLTTTVPSEAELASYKVIATIAASNPHWKSLAGETKEYKPKHEEVIATILSVILLARELGIPPMVAVSGGIYQVRGKFELSARMMNMLIRKRGHIIQKRISNKEVCKLFGKRIDNGNEMEATYHIQEAENSGLIKEYGAWKNNREDMLFARALSKLARQLFADCLGGCYVEGELQETLLKRSMPSIDVPEMEITDQQVKPEKEQFNFQIPDDITKESIEIYLNESAETHETTVEVLINAANKRPNDFLNAIRKWEEKNVSSAEVEAIDV